MALYETMVEMDHGLVNRTRSGRLVRTPGRHHTNNAEKVEFFKSMPKDRMTPAEKIRYSTVVRVPYDAEKTRKHQEGQKRYEELWANADDIETWPSLEEMLDCWE